MCKVNCAALYDVIFATIKLKYDSLFGCCKKKNKIKKQYCQLF